MDELTRRQALRRGGIAGAAALVAAALPVAERLPAARAAGAGAPDLADATLQAFADTMIPGRRVARTESGRPVHPGAIAGADPRPGAVEADALALYANRDVGFGALEPAFLADLEARALPHGGPFLELGYEARVAACLAGLDPGNPTFVIWEAAAAVPFTAFCAAALVPDATWHDAVGYRVMGLPGAAPEGYRDYSWRRVLSRELTATGSLP
jgi:hypothetical protein